MSVSLLDDFLPDQVLVSYRYFHQHLEVAATKAGSFSLYNISTFESSCRQMFAFWTAYSAFFAREFYTSKNFQLLHNRMNYLMSNPPVTMIAFGCALLEARDLSQSLLVEFKL